MYVHMETTTRDSFLGGPRAQIMECRRTFQLCRRQALGGGSPRQAAAGGA